MEKIEFKNKQKKEISKKLHDIDNRFDINANSDLLINILQLDLSNYLKDVNDLNNCNLEFIKKYTKDDIDNNYFKSFCTNFEPFVKLIYLIVSKNPKGENISDEIKRIQSIKNAEFKEKKVWMMNDFMKLLNHHKYYYCDQNNKKTYRKNESKLIDNNLVYYKNENDEKEYVKIKDSSLKTDFLNLSDAQDYISKKNKYKNTFLEHLTYALVLKNKGSHTSSSFSIITKYEGISSVLISMLYLVDIFHDEIKDFIYDMKYNPKKIEQYLNNLELKIKDKKISYVPLDIIQIDGDDRHETNIKDELNNHNHILLLGNAGAGKSTTLEYLVLDDISNFPEKKIIPAMISLSNVSSMSSLHDELITLFDKNLDLKFSEEMAHGKVNLYLDGINEILGVTSEGFQQKIINEIISLHENYPDSKIITTDRNQSEIINLNYFEFPAFIINELSDTKIEDFVKFYAKSDVEIDNINTLFNESNNLKNIIKSPLMITSVIELINNKRKVPDNESKIIKNFLQILFEREKIEKKDTYLSIHKHTLLLAFLAHKIHFEYKSNKAISTYKLTKIILDGLTKFGFEYDTFYFKRVSIELNILSWEQDNYIKFSHERYKDHYVAEYEIYELS